MVKHYIFDGLNVENEYMENEKKFILFLNIINKKYINGDVYFVPYFRGKILNDCGLTGCIIKNKRHFTCHTFSYHKILYIDSYGINKIHDLKKDILSIFFTRDYYDNVILRENNRNISYKNKKKFGLHIIINIDYKIEKIEAINFINKILKDINMQVIHDLIIYEHKKGYDLIQLIAESHISCHCYNNKTYFDIFSCKNYNINKIKKIFKNYEFEINQIFRYRKNI